MKIPKIFKPSEWKLTPKLLTAFLLTAVLPALAASLFSLSYFYGVSYDNAKKNLAKELGMAIHFLDEQKQRLLSDTRLAAKENVVALNLSLGLSSPVLDYLEALRTERHLALAYLLDPRGRPVSRAAEGTSETAPLGFLTENLMTAARDRNGIAFHVTGDDGKVLLLSMVPVDDDQGQPGHFLILGIDPGSGEPGGILDTLRQDVSGPVVFAGTRGIQGEAPGSPLWDPGVDWPRVYPAPGSLVPVEARGTTYLFGFAGVGEDEHHPDAWLGVSFSLDGFQQVTNAAAEGLVFIAVLGVLISCLAAILFSRGLTRPLLMMARQAGAWTEGLGGKRLEVTSNDETGILGRAFNDVLDRLDRTLDSLRKTQNYLKNIFNSLTSVLVSVDETGSVQEWNIAAERFSGTKAAEALGRKVWKLSAVFQGVEPLMVLAVATREPQYLKKELGQPGDKKRSFDLCLYPLVWNGVSGVVIRMDDITDSLKKDRQLLQAQKMETIGTLAGGIAHNFNNLLTGITGTVSLVTLDLADGGPVDPDQIRLRMSMVEESTRRASEIVRRLMGLTRENSGEFGPQDLASIVRETVNTSRMLLDSSVEIEVRSAPGPALVYGDRSQLEQGLLNLIINAAHAVTFMRPTGDHTGGTVRVTLQVVNDVKDFPAAHQEAVKNSYWLLQVQDNGVGISPENLPKIFDPFFTTKTQEKGSGLGLATVYATVRQHNGFIDTYSEVGRGTNFRLYLPVLQETVPAVPGTVSREPEVIYRGTGLVLVVDDEVVVQTTAKEILQACGYRVVIANNGEEALALYADRGREIKAVLLDSSMPKLSGAETLGALKALDPGVRVVMSSGLFDGKSLLAGAGDDHIRFLPKPYSLTELSAVLHSLLGERT